MIIRTQKVATVVVSITRKITIELIPKSENENTHSNKKHNSNDLMIVIVSKMASTTIITTSIVIIAKQ